jgi:hypothetical protein
MSQSSDLEYSQSGAPPSQDVGNKIFEGAASIGVVMAKVGVAVGALAFLIFAVLGSMLLGTKKTEATATIVTLNADSTVVSFSVPAVGPAQPVTTVQATLAGAPAKDAKVGDQFSVWYDVKEPTKNVDRGNPKLAGGLMIGGGVFALLWSILTLVFVERFPLVAAGSGVMFVLSLFAPAFKAL